MLEEPLRLRSGEHKRPPPRSLLTSVAGPLHLSLPAPASGVRLAAALRVTEAKPRRAALIGSTCRGGAEALRGGSGAIAQRLRRPVGQEVPVTRGGGPAWLEPAPLGLGEAGTPEGVLAREPAPVEGGLEGAEGREARPVALWFGHLARTSTPTWTTLRSSSAAGRGVPGEAREAHGGAGRAPHSRQEQRPEGAPAGAEGHGRLPQPANPFPVPGEDGSVSFYLEGKRGRRGRRPKGEAGISKRRGRPRKSATSGALYSVARSFIGRFC
jgi:hypothetical protein